MAKRTIDKVDDVDVSDVVSVLDNAKVHGIVTELSPVKLSRKNQKYFSGKMSDGKKTMRVLSFEPTLHGAMEKSRIDGNPIALANCQIKEASLRYASGSEDTPFEIWTSRRSHVESSSEKSFDLTDVEKKYSVVALEDLVNIAVNERVVVSIKVVDMEETRTIKNKYGKEFTMQNVMVADGTAQCRVVLWETEVGKLELDKSYRLENVAVRVFNDVKHLSFTEGTVVALIEDITEIADPPLAKDGQLFQEKNLVLEGEVVGVMSVEEYVCCVGCQGKVIRETDVIGECGRCKMKVKMSRCKRGATAHVVFEGDNGVQKNLVIFDEQLKKVCGDSSLTWEENLLNCGKLKMCISEKHVVISATVV